MLLRLLAAGQTGADDLRDEALDEDVLDAVVAELNRLVAAD
jgi:hypothetical protein